MSSDFYDALAAELDREPTMCACGHPSVLHADRFGCMAATDRAGSARCRCRWAGEPCPCDDCREPSMCRCGHPSVLHADRFGCTARWEHDSGSDTCPCEVGTYRPAGPDPRLEGADGAPPGAGPVVTLTYLARGIQRIDTAAEARAAGGEGEGR